MDESKEKKNSSKDIVLIILLMSVLVLAVVGVTFAVFSYTKDGEENNVITTGSVFFNFSEGDAILLQNQFPTQDENGMSLSNNEDARNVLTFTINGHDTASKGIEYTIYALKGKVPTGLEPNTYEEKNRLTDKDIKLYLVPGAGDDEITVTENKYTTPNTVAYGLVSDTFGDDIKEGCLIATGKIAGKTNEDVQKSFTLKMWISDQVTIVSDEDAKSGIENPKAGVYTEEEFGNMFYSLKIAIDAKTAK